MASRKSPTHPAKDRRSVARIFGRQIAGEASPGAEIALRHADQHRAAAIERPADQVEQAAALALRFAELVEDEDVGIALQRARHGSPPLRQRGCIQTAAAGERSATYQYLGPGAGRQILQRDVAAAGR